MPIYEYNCTDCKVKFEKMRPMSKADAEAVCPECGSTHTSRGLSLFAAFSKGNGEARHAVAGDGGCARCGSHSCGSCGHH
jgi:putative FmdB family regulatory protein